MKTLTRWGFVCGFPVIFLSLATNLWATGRAFTSTPGPELAFSFVMALNLFLFPVFCAGVLFDYRRKGRPIAYPRLLPVFLGREVP
jgi:hypothetical protein